MTEQTCILSRKPDKICTFFFFIWLEKPFLAEKRRKLLIMIMWEPSIYKYYFYSGFYSEIFSVNMYIKRGNDAEFKIIYSWIFHEPVMNVPCKSQIKCFAVFIFISLLTVLCS